MHGLYLQFISINSLLAVFCFTWLYSLNLEAHRSTFLEVLFLLVRTRTSPPQMLSVKGKNTVRISRRHFWKKFGFTCFTWFTLQSPRHVPQYQSIPQLFVILLILLHHGHQMGILGLTDLKLPRSHSESWCKKKKAFTEPRSSIKERITSSDTGASIGMHTHTHKAICHKRAAASVQLAEIHKKESHSSVKTRTHKHTAETGTRSHSQGELFTLEGLCES